MIQPLPQVYTMLVALDECSYWSELLEWLEKVTGWNVENMYFICNKHGLPWLLNPVSGS